MATSIAVRCSLTTICALAVLLVCTTTMAAAESHNLEVAINGSTFVYKKLADTSSALDTNVTSDVTAAVSEYATIADGKTVVNDTAMFFQYTATLVAGHTVDEVIQRVYESTLPTTNRALEDAKSAFLSATGNARFEEMYPTNVRPFKPLVPSNDTPQPSMLVTVQSKHSIYFSGDVDAWSYITLPTVDDVQTSISAAVAAAMTQSNMIVKCTVDELQVRPADHTLTKPGDGRSGLTAHVTVTQQLTHESKFAYNALEVSSTILTMNVTNINALYATANPTGVKAVEIISVALISEQVADNMWTPSKVGVVAMGACIVALMIVAFVCFVVVGCCLWDYCCGAAAESAEQKNRAGLSPMHGYVFETPDYTQDSSRGKDQYSSPCV